MWSCVWQGRCSSVVGEKERQVSCVPVSFRHGLPCCGKHLLCWLRQGLTTKQENDTVPKVSPFIVRGWFSSPLTSGWTRKQELPRAPEVPLNPGPALLPPFPQHMHSTFPVPKVSVLTSSHEKGQDYKFSKGLNGSRTTVVVALILLWCRVITCLSFWARWGS